jgi:hypothetical protein
MYSFERIGDLGDIAPEQSLGYWCIQLPSALLRHLVLTEVLIVKGYGIWVKVVYKDQG